MKEKIPFVFLILLAACSSKPVEPPLPLGPLPSSAQLAWHEMEMNAFIHFSINTFTDKEWGFGNESPGLFNPSQLDVEQWVTVLKEAGFKGIILTCKHHDGFCLWPSKHTDHSVKNSPYKGDVVKELSQSCKKQGLRFGIYLSPWDRNHAEYGRPAYLDYYREQLKELFVAYPPVFEMWFDGANGGTGYYGGKNEKRTINGATYYDWPSTLSLVRQFQPDIIFFSDAGPGVRWIGNERGIAGETNWNTITPDTLFAGKGGINDLLNNGSETGTQWIPGEVDVSIRPGWFYHAKEDTLVKTPEQLFEIYLTSVGRGSTLLLNVPPDRRGLLNEKDVASLRGWKQLRDSVFRENLAAKAKVKASAYRGSSALYGPEKVVDGDKTTYWSVDDDEKLGTLEIELNREEEIKYVVIQEYIALGQRVKSFSIDVWEGNAWKKVGEGTTIGYKRIVKIDKVKTGKVRISIIDAKACPVISNVEIF
ncbi:MAG TPA: alpha-L-fucosidase [Cyclobacteriaceae bacterium]|nr:alpha-L-fucosidase [Cyclobacteriaceae bacterium]